MFAIKVQSKRYLDNLDELLDKLRRYYATAARLTIGDTKNIDDYIVTFTANVQYQLRELRSAIKEAAPDAKESISYGMPTFKLNGNLVNFAAYKKHIGSYVPSSVIVAFRDQYVYKQSKGTVPFPIDRPIPLGA